MHPILFEIGGFPIRSYGVLVAAAFLAGIALARRDAPRIGVDPEAVADLGVWVILSAIAGSRLCYVLFYQWDAFAANPLIFFRVWEGGLVFYGGLAGAIAASVVFLTRRGLPVLRVMDLAAPAIALGQSIGRIGCFLNGCCFGRLCTWPIGITFPGHAQPAHPTQLYESAAQLFWAVVLWKLRTRVTRPGGLISLYVLTYGATRFALEFVRGDGNPVLGAGLTLSQWISALAVGAVGLVWGGVWVRRLRGVVHSPPVAD